MYESDTEIKRATITHPDNTESYSFIFRMGPFTSTPYKTEGAAKAGMTRMIKRGGVSQRWVDRHGSRVYAYAVKKMIAGRIREATSK